MRGVSIRKPGRSLAICLAASALAAWAVATGALEIRATGAQSGLPHLKVGMGLVFLILGPLMAFNFWRGVRAIADLKAGKRVVARWTAPPDEFAKFQAADAARSALGDAYRNWIRPRPEKPGAGVEVIFGDDALLVGDEYVGLPAAGMLRFGGVQILSGDPPMIEFGVAFTSAYNTGSAIRTVTNTGVVRAPIAEAARDEALIALRHFKEVREGRVAANPGFFPSRRRLGVGAIAIGVLSAVVGFLFRESGSVAALVAAIAGVIVALGGAVVATIAWVIDPYRNKKFF